MIFAETSVHIATLGFLMSTRIFFPKHETRGSVENPVIFMIFLENKAPYLLRIIDDLRLAPKQPFALHLAALVFCIRKAKESGLVISRS